MDPKENRVKITKLSKYVFVLPSAWKSLIGILFIPSLIYPFSHNVLFILTLPALITLLLLYFLGVSLRKSAFLTFFSTCLLAILFILSLIFSMALLIFGYCLIAIPYFLSFRYSFPFSRIKSLLLATIHPIIGLISLSFFIPPWIILIKALATSFVLASFTIFFLFVLDYPMKKIFGVGALELGMGLVVNWTSNDVLLESILSKVGEDVKTKMVRIAFKGGDGDVFNIFIPYFHLGPFGNIGGSAFTDVVKTKYPKSAVLHGTATHDFNPLLSDFSQCLDVEIEHWGGASKSIRIGNVPSALVQKFAGKNFVFSTFSPNATEDIDYGLGLALMERGDCFFVDAHNCYESGYHAVDVGTEKGEKLLELAKRVKGLRLKEQKIRFGYAVDDFDGYTVEDGIGPLGLRVLVVESDGQKTGYVMFDANNMVKGLREKIIGLAKNYVDECEVMTSDSHSVNLLSTPENPLGMRIAEDVILSKVKHCFESVRLKEGQVGWGEKEINLRVFGSKRIAELIAASNTMINVMKFVAPFIMFVGIAVSLMVCMVI